MVRQPRLIDMTAVYVVGAILAVLVAVLIWEHWSFTHAPIRFVIAVGSQSKWQTRPLLMRVVEDKELVGAVVHVLEEAGYAPPKVLLFQGQPTMDLLLDSDTPGTTSSQISDLLQTFLFESRPFAARDCHCDTTDMARPPNLAAAADGNRCTLIVVCYSFACGCRG